MNQLQTSTSSSVDGLLGEALDEFLQRQARGEQPDTEEYAQRYPQIAPVLREMLPTLQWTCGPAGNDAAPAGAAAPAAYLPGYLGDYHILREVGRGGMGVVYEAHQVSLNRRVALKVLPFVAAMDTRHLQRFKNEAQAAAQLHHPHVVPVYGVGCERGMHYYAMQFIEGPTVAALVHELTQCGERQPSGSGPASPPPAPAEGPGRVVPDTGPIADLPTEHSAGSPAFFRTVARLGVQAAEALEHAHAFGVVHRDVKPANLLVDGRGHLWVTDFGLARLQNDVGLTRTGDLVGTLRYMSPEQALAKHGLVDHRTDIYSLGATLYELLTLRPACPGDDRQEVLRRIEREDPKPPRALNPAIPADLETVVLKALAKDLDSRYASAQELAEDLARFLDHKPIRAKSPTLLERTRKWSRRHHGVVVTAGVAVVALLATVVIALAVGIYQVKGEQRAAEKERQLAVIAQGRARKSYELAREGLEECVRQLTGDPRLQGGELEDLRRAVWQVEAQFFRKFSELRGDEPDFRVERGKTLRRLGTVSGYLGNQEDATRAYENAVAIFAGLVREHPEAAEYRALLATCRNNLGTAYLRTGQPGRAEQVLQDALAAEQALLANHPAVPEFQEYLALTCLNLGNVYERTRRPREADQAYRKAVTLQENLARQHPDVPKYRLQLARSCNNLGVLCVTTRRQDEAKQAYQKALALRQELAHAFPRDDRYQSDLGHSWTNLGDWYHLNDQPRAAAQAFHEALGIQEALAREHPLVTGYAVDLGATQLNLGNLTSDPGPTEASLSWYTQSIATLETVVARERSHAMARGVLFNAYKGRFLALSNLGRHREALDDLDRQMELVPAGARRNLVRLDRAKTLAKLRRPREAVAEAKDLLRGPGIDAKTLVLVAAVYSRASAAARADDPGQAEEYAVRAVALLRRAVAQGAHDAAGINIDSDFDALRQRTDFRKLLVELERGQESNRP